MVSFIGGMSILGPEEKGECRMEINTLEEHISVGPRTSIISFKFKSNLG